MPFSIAVVAISSDGTAAVVGFNTFSIVRKGATPTDVECPTVAIPGVEYSW